MPHEAGRPTSPARDAAQRRQEGRWRTFRGGGSLSPPRRAGGHPQRFQREIPDYVVLMNDFKTAGLAHTKGSKTPKLTITAPATYPLADGCIASG